MSHWYSCAALLSKGYWWADRGMWPWYVAFTLTWLTVLVHEDVCFCVLQGELIHPWDFRLIDIFCILLGSIHLMKTLFWNGSIPSYRHKCLRMMWGHPLIWCIQAPKTALWRCLMNWRLTLMCSLSQHVIILVWTSQRRSLYLERWQLVTVQCSTVAALALVELINYSIYFQSSSPGDNGTIHQPRVVP